MKSASRVVLFVLLTSVLFGASFEDRLAKTKLELWEFHRFRKFGEQIVDLTPLMNKAANDIDFTSDGLWWLIQGKVLSVSTNGLLIDARKSPTGSKYDTRVVFVKNAHRQGYVDDDTFWNFAKAVGVYQYIAVSGARKTVDMYDFGETPTEEEKRPFLERERVAREREKAEREAAIQRYNEEMAAKAKAKQDQAEQKVLEFQRKRASEGAASAQYELGMRYMDGRGVERNPEEGLRLLRLSAAQGYSQAKRALDALEKAK